MICMILRYELKNVDDMNNLRLWMIWKILGHKLKAEDVMNSLGLRMK